MNLGGYQIERTLEDGPLGAAYVVRGEGSRELLARTCRVDLTFATPGREYERARLFFLYAQTQKRFADATAGRAGDVGRGGAHLAAVHEIVADEDGGYLITDRYPLTAQRLIDTRFAATGAAVYQLMRGVLGGLALLAEAGGGRPHGRIEPACVLIDDSAGVNRWRVGLESIAPGPQLVGTHEQLRHEDLQAVGRLLYQVVTHQPFNALSNYPVTDVNGQWARLGANSAGWLRIANWLLDPAARRGAFDLEQVTAEVDKLREKVKNPKPLIALGGAAAVLALAGGVAAFVVFGGERTLPPVGEFSLTQADGWIAAYQDEDGWLDEFYAEQAPAEAELWLDPELRARVEREETLSAIADPLARIGELEMQMIGEAASTVERLPDLDPFIAYRQKDVGLQRVLPANRAVFRDALVKGIGDGSVSPEAQGRLGGLNRRVALLTEVVNEELADWSAAEFGARVSAWRASGWDGPADELEAAAAGARIGTLEEYAAGEEPDGPALAPMLKSMLDLRDRAAEIDESWSRLADLGAAARDAGAASGDQPAESFLLGLGDAITAHVRDAAGVGELSARLSAIDEVAGGEDGFAAFLAGDWRAEVDRIALAESGSVEGVNADDPAGAMRVWLAAASSPEFRVLRGDDDPRAAWLNTEDPTELKAALAQIEEWRGDERYGPRLAKQLAAWEADRGAAFEDEAAAVIRDAGELIAERGYGGNRDALAARFASLSTRAAALLSEYRSEIESNVLVQWGEYVAGLRQREELPRDDATKPGLDAVHEVWRARRDELIDRHAADQNAPALYGEVQDGLIPALQEVARAVRAEVDASAVPGGFDAEAFAGAVADRNEAAARALLADLERAWIEDGGGVLGYARSSPVFQQAVAAARLERDSWAAAATRLVEDVAEAESLIGLGYRIEEEADQGASLRVIADGVLGRPPLTGAQGGAMRSALGEPLERLEQLAAVEAIRDPAELVRTAEEAWGASLALTAYRVLGSNGGAAWPRAGAELERDGAALAAARGLLAGIGDADRRAAAGAWLAAAAADRWRAAMANAGSAADVRTLLAATDRYGIDLNTEAAAVRLNWELARLDEIDRGAARSDGDVRADVRSAHQRLDALVRELGGSVPPAVRTLVDGLGRLSVQQAGDETRFDFGTVGPGQRGWSATWTPPGQEPVIATYSNGGQQVSFVIMDPRRFGGQGDPFAVCTEEVSIGLFARLVELDGGGAAEWKNALLPGIDETSVVRGWTYDPGNGRVQAAANWLGKLDDRYNDADGYRPYTDVFNTGADLRLAARPTSETAMHLVPGSAAVRAAEAIGCRLPTAAEWRLVYQQYEQSRPASAWHRIDGDFTAQVRHGEATVNRVGEQIATNFPWPGDNTYDDLLRVWNGRDAARLPQGAGDGLLWFDSVGSPRGGVLRNMVGNVAEFVTMPGGGFAILGGSCLSIPRTVAEDAGQPVEGGRVQRRGFLDVGFRLAFTASGYKPSVAGQLDLLLAQREFLLGGG